MGSEVGRTVGSTIICGNIRGISPGIRSNKIDYIRNLCIEKEAFAVMLTESHLSDNILDCEVSIDGWSTFRADRTFRSGGGVITYISDKLTVSNEISGSDSMTEFLCLYINDLNIGAINIYRPPSATVQSLSKSLEMITNWMTKIENEFSEARFFVSGDFNIKEMKSWDEDTINEMKETVLSRNDSDNDSITDIGVVKLNSMNMIEFIEKWNLLQYIKVPTRKDNILDLIFTDDTELIEDISQEVHSAISDHNTIVVSVNVNSANSDTNETRENFSTTQIPLYKTDNLDKDIVRKIKNDLINTDWNGVSVESLTNTIEEVIVKHCEKKGAIEKNKEGKNFRSKNKIPRTVRLWMRRKNFASKKILLVK